ncbi:MAG: AAA family ATPase [Clostridiales bacterium]|nr:AAA family ATPase [Clostridiales bacterium]
MDKFTIDIPEFCLVALVGATSAGKSSFAKRHFKPTETLSSDFFRAMICDDENEQSISGDAFELLYDALNKRLKNGKLTVVDATSVQKSARTTLLNIAQKHNARTAAIVLNPPEDVLHARNTARPDRHIPDGVVREHYRELMDSIASLNTEGFDFVYILNSLDQIDNAQIVRTKR